MTDSAVTDQITTHEYEATQRPLTPMQAVFAWCSYPVVMGAAMAFALWKSAHLPERAGEPLWRIPIGDGIGVYQYDIELVIAYILPVVCVAMAVGLMEKLQPFSRAWKPKWNDNVRSDIGIFFMNNVVLRADVLVQFGMAAGLGLLAGGVGLGVWPDEWPVVLQVALFLLLAEFLSYWFHRLEHTWFPMWRIHSVHHNPRRLYWLNATRFHYFDIILLPLLGNLPCVILGASVEVLYLATTFSVMHGFWQHCNARVRFGWLNYVVSSPELHRWHHMRDTKLANHNYGSNLIVWDLVFGTWMLPKRDPDPLAIGVHEMEGDGVLKQLLMPFKLKAK
ncbi:MAG: sterol desaturase family protein [Pseudomonadota bacterium]